MKSFNLEERERIMKLNTYRADVIIPAMKIFLTVGKICKINEIIVPKLGLSDGIIRLLYEEEKRGRSIDFTSRKRVKMPFNTLLKSKTTTRLNRSLALNH